MKEIQMERLRQKTHKSNLVTQITEENDFLKSFK